MIHMPRRASKWMNRIFHGEGRTAPLDWGTELWKWGVSRYESADGISAALLRAGKSADDFSVLYEATRNLLLDVVDAAGGVEQAHHRLHEAMAGAREAQARFAASFGRPAEDGMGLSDPTVEAAWYAIEELILWTRILDDRLRRPALDHKRYPDQGLIPALADGPRRDAVIAARSRLLQGGVQEARYLAGLNLHMQSSQAGTKHGRIKDGEVILQFPDRVTAPIGHRWQLTYRDGRDAVTFADGLMEAVARFMDDMIRAFEEHLPERFQAS